MPGLNTYTDSFRFGLQERAERFPLAAMAVHTDAVQLRRRPAPALSIEIPQQLVLPDEDSAVAPSALHHTQHTPVHRALFEPCTGSSEQQQPPTVPARCCVVQWLDVMQGSSRQSCSSASSISSFSSISAGGALSDTPRSSSNTSLAVFDPSAQQQEAAECCAQQPCLPPPAFVVLGLLSRP